MVGKDVEVDCETKEGNMFCKVKKGKKKGEFGIGVGSDGKPKLLHPKGNLPLIKEVKDDIAEIVRIKGIEGAAEEF